jgi:hypothetical protein
MCAMNPRLLRPKASGFKYQSLRSGLVAYWPLNETATSGDVTARDESGKGNNLTSNNSVLSTTGKIGNARDFVAANSEFLSIASNTDMQFGDKDWTISLWFNLNDTNSYQIVAKDASGGREFECSSATTGGNTRLTTVFYHSGGSVSVVAPNPGSLATGTWHFLALRHINSTGVISGRINTTTGLTFTRPAGQTWNATSTEFRLGARAFSPFQNFLNGKIDECARWSRALSDAELTELYNNGNGINLGQRS